MFQQASETTPNIGDIHLNMEILISKAKQSPTYIADADRQCLQAQFHELAAALQIDPASQNSAASHHYDDDLKMLILDVTEIACSEFLARHNTQQSSALKTRETIPLLRIQNGGYKRRMQENVLKSAGGNL